MIQVSFGRLPDASPMELWEFAIDYLEMRGYKVIETSPLQGVYVSQDDVFILVFLEGQDDSL